MEGGGGSAPSMTVTVRWLSAMPVQQAMAKKLHRPAPPAEPAPAYFIGVFGLPARMSGARDDFKQMLQKATTLKIKGREPVNPESIEVGPAEGGTAAIFRFSNQEPISADDKEVEFLSRVGQIEIKTKFKTKDMMVDDMKRFFFENFMTMADTYMRATNDQENSNEIKKFAEAFGRKTGIDK